jgi:Fe-S-cluster-containing dehydrogenase component
LNKWNLIINVGRCENCHNCVIANRDEHVGNDFPGYTAPAAAVGDSPIRILRRTQGSAPMVETTYLPVMCNHCDDAPCIRRAGDAIRKRDDGIVIIDPVKSRGRKDIVDSCPYGAIVWNDEQQVPQTWNFDVHLLDQDWQIPRCQQSCPTDVFEAVKVDDAAMKERAAREQLKVLKPDLGTKPRVWYRGLERWETCFVGGSVSAEIAGAVECIEGAEVTLSQGSARLARMVTDSFGDFRFDGLPGDGGTYRVEASHANGNVRRDCVLNESAYLGELRLTRPKKPREDPESVRLLSTGHPGTLEEFAPASGASLETK